MDINLTVEDQEKYIDEIAQIMDRLNEDLPPIAGDGNLVDALNYVCLELCSTALHAQRTTLLIKAILDALTAQGTTGEGFKKAGEDFSGIATSIN